MKVHIEPSGRKKERGSKKGNVRKGKKERKYVEDFVGKRRRRSIMPAILYMAEMVGGDGVATRVMGRTNGQILFRSAR